MALLRKTLVKQAQAAHAQQPSQTLGTALEQSHGEALAFPVKFSRISNKSTDKKLVMSVGLSTVKQTVASVEGKTALPVKYHSDRVVRRVVVHKQVDELGHWYLMFHAEQPLGTLPKPPKTTLVPKLVKVDLTQERYRIIYNAAPEESLITVEYEFVNGAVRLDDIYRTLADVAVANGEWKEKGYNCQGFVNVVVERLATQGLGQVMSSKQGQLLQKIEVAKQ